MEELLKMWFSNELEHLAGLEIKGELVLPKELVSETLLKPSTEVQTSSKTKESESILSSADYNNMLNHLLLKDFSLQLNEGNILIKLDLTR